MNRPDDINLSREEGEALIERLETQTCTAEDLQVVAQVVRLYFWLLFALKQAPCGRPIRVLMKWTHPCTIKEEPRSGRVEL